MDELIVQLKSQIIESLNIEDVEPEDIDPNESLYEEGLGLDSIDVLELIVMVEKEYGLKVKNAEIGKKVFQTVQTIADYITTPEKFEA